MNPKEQLKHAYDCTTTEDIAALRGKRDGLCVVLDAMEQIEAKGTRAREEHAKFLEKEKLDAVEIDSTDL